MIQMSTKLGSGNVWSWLAKLSETGVFSCYQRMTPTQKTKQNNKRTNNNNNNNTQSKTKQKRRVAFFDKLAD